MILSEQTQTSQRAQLRKKIEDTIRQIKRFHSFCARLLAPHIRKELQKRLEKGEGQVEHA